MKTWFLISIEISGQTIKYGPYLSFEEACKICAEDILTILLASNIKVDSYTAAIQEVTLVDNHWELVNTKLTITEKI